MDILIVGGTGVISFAVVNEALKRGHHVTCINRGKSKNQVLPEEVEILTADYRNKNQMKEILQQRFFDVVVDVLCYTENDIEYSVSLFKNICRQYIFFSSCAVYNKGKGNYECIEDSPLINPVWQYSIDKVASEKKLIELAKLNHFYYTIVRPAVTYGNTRIPYGITPLYGYHGTLIQRILHHKPIVLWDNGEAYSTITRVEDFAIGLVGLFGNEKAINQAFHIVGDERYKWKEVIEILGDILHESPIYFNLDKETLAKEMPHRKGEILGGRGISQLLNNDKIKDAVPYFKTNISLRQGLEMTVNYYKENNWLSGIDYAFDGDWDRIISKYDNLYKPIFIDYLEERKEINRQKYNASLQKNIKLSYCKEKAIVFLRKIKSYVK